MKLPIEKLVIADEKLTRYLLVWRDEDDKSAFLAKAGFTQDNPSMLAAALRTLVANHEAEVDRRNEYGIFYRVVGDLVGPADDALVVVTIWLNELAADVYRFVTLKPWRQPKDDP